MFCRNNLQFNRQFLFCSAVLLCSADSIYPAFVDSAVSAVVAVMRGAWRITVRSVCTSEQKACPMLRREYFTYRFVCVLIASTQGLTAADPAL